MAVRGLYKVSVGDSGEAAAVDYQRMVEAAESVMGCCRKKGSVRVGRLG